MTKIYLALLVLVLSFPAIGQNRLASFSSLSQLSVLLDTIKVGRQHVYLRRTWLKDTIELRKLVYPVTYDLEIMRRYEKDSTFVPNKEEEQNSINWVKRGAQNCYSYALEKYFEDINISPDEIFDKNSQLSRNGIEAIVAGSFIKINEFPTNKRQNFREAVPDGVLVIFRLKGNRITHAIYHDKGVFYSKNGGWEAKEYKKLKEIYDVYRDTEVIQFYKLNQERIAQFFSLNKQEPGR